MWGRKDVKKIKQLPANFIPTPLSDDLNPGENTRKQNISWRKYNYLQNSVLAVYLGNKNGIGSKSCLLFKVKLIQLPK